MGVGLVRSLQPPDILWIHWRVYNSIANTSKGVFFCPLLMPMSEAFSISQLYFNKTLLHKSSERSSLVSGPGLNLSPPEAKNPASYHSATTFQGPSHGPQFSVRTKRRIWGLIHGKKKFIKEITEPLKGEVGQAGVAPVPKRRGRGFFKTGLSHTYLGELAVLIHSCKSHSSRLSCACLSHN